MKNKKGTDALPTEPTELPKITAKNLLKPEGLWMAAIGRWMEGASENVQRLLREGNEIPPFARDWLARLASGEVKKKRGAKKQYPPLHDLLPVLVKDIEVRQYFNRQMILEKHSGRPAFGCTPKERAIAATAENFGLSEEAVSHIVYQRKKRGT